jgi:hypothetical protein
MKPAFILMLTYNDSTVKDALQIFRKCKDAPVTHWGFKDIGLPPDEMKGSGPRNKQQGKTTYLEIVSLSKRRSAMCKNSGGSWFEVLMGTVLRFDPGIFERQAYQVLSLPWPH